MKRSLTSSVRRLLRYRLLGGLVISPEARVEPTRFSEDEFPVVCPKCSYLLRGLPDGLCPECGTRFERGRLLVEQYVLEQGKRFAKPVPQIAMWCGIVGVFTAGLGCVVPCGWMLLGLWEMIPFATFVGILNYMGWWFRVVMVASAVLLLAATSLLVWLALRVRHKVRQVRDAIGMTLPSDEANRRDC